MTTPIETVPGAMARVLDPPLPMLDMWPRPLRYSALSDQVRVTSADGQDGACLLQITNGYIDERTALAKFIAGALNERHLLHADAALAAISAPEAQREGLAGTDDVTLGQAIRDAVIDHNDMADVDWKNVARDVRAALPVAREGLAGRLAELSAKATQGPWQHVVGDDYYIESDSYPPRPTHSPAVEDSGHWCIAIGNRPQDFGEATSKFIVELVNAYRSGALALHAPSQPIPQEGGRVLDGPCDMGVGCDEYGVCFAEAHGEPDRCGRLAAPQPPENMVLRFGDGRLVIDTGKFHGRTAVFIRPVDASGAIGEKPRPEHQTPLDQLEPGETVLTFPTAEQAMAVLDALFNRAAPQPPTPSAAPDALAESGKLIAGISLWRDEYPDGPDILCAGGDDHHALLKVTPAQVRSARASIAQAETGKAGASDPRDPTNRAGWEHLAEIDASPEPSRQGVEAALTAVRDFMEGDRKSGDSALWSPEYADIYDTVTAALSTPSTGSAER